MKIVKQNLQKVLMDDTIFRKLCEENPWGFILESSKTLFKVTPQQQWNQCFYKGHWSFSIMEEK